MSHTCVLCSINDVITCYLGDVVLQGSRYIFFPSSSEHQHLSAMLGNDICLTLYGVLSKSQAKVCLLHENCIPTRFLSAKQTAFCLYENRRGAFENAGPGPEVMGRIGVIIRGPGCGTLLP